MLPATTPLKVRGHISESLDLNLRARKTKSEYSEFSPQHRHNKVGLAKTENGLGAILCLPYLQPAGSRSLCLADSGDRRAEHTRDLEVKHCAALAARCTRLVGSAAAPLLTASIEGLISTEAEPQTLLAQYRRSPTFSCTVSFLYPAFPSPEGKLFTQSRGQTG